MLGLKWKPKFSPTHCLLNTYIDPLLPKLVLYSKHYTIIKVHSVPIAACRYIVSVPYCLLYYGTFCFLLDTSLVGSLVTQ